jgi:CubicO group peptidase (beta-lactamase class C family)
MKRHRSFVLILALLLCARAAPGATLPEEINRLAAPLVDASGQDPARAVGLVVVVVTSAGSQTFGFGALHAGGTTPPDGDTFFQIGSVSKTLTGLILASVIESSGGAVQPATPVNALLAPDLRMPGFGAQPVTVAQLATHYGGLPQFPTNLTGPPFYPAQGYSRAQLSNFLAGFALNAPPGTAYEYSNTGFGLLALALGDHTGAGSYSALLGAWLTGPLGMADTGLNEAPFTNTVAARLAQGYRSTGTALVPMTLSDMGVLEGAGEVISTGNDIAKLLRALAGLAPFPILGAVERAVSPRAPGTPGTMTGYGLDIYTLPGGAQQWEKAGLVAGYTAYIAFRRVPGNGVVILSNRGQHSDVVPLARQVLALLTPPQLNIEIPAPGQARVAFMAAGRLTYDVQVSTNLADWITATSLTNSSTTEAVLETTLPATAPAQYFRLRY